MGATRVRGGDAQSFVGCSRFACIRSPVGPVSDRSP
jgi:hypothetical protein